MRKSVGHTRHLEAVDEAQLNESVSLVGGRLAYLNKIAKSTDMIGMAKHLLEIEKAWLLSQIGQLTQFPYAVFFFHFPLNCLVYASFEFAGLIPDCDDDVMDEVCVVFTFSRDKLR